MNSETESCLESGGSEGASPVRSRRRESKASGRLSLAFRLFRCALFHGLIARRKSYRCPVCQPRRRQKLAVEREGKEGGAR